MKKNYKYVMWQMEINKYEGEKGSLVITYTFGTYILDYLVNENQNSFLLSLTLSFSWQRGGNNNNNTFQLFTHKLKTLHEMILVLALITQAKNQQSKEALSPSLLRMFRKPLFTHPNPSLTNWYQEHMHVLEFLEFWSFQALEWSV